MITTAWMSHVRVRGYVLPASATASRRRRRFSLALSIATMVSALLPEHVSSLNFCVLSTGLPSRWPKPSADFKNKSSGLAWPGQVRLGQNGTFLLFRSQLEVLANVPCHPVNLWRQFSHRASHYSHYDISASLFPKWEILKFISWYAQSINLCEALVGMIVANVLWIQFYADIVIIDVYWETPPRTCSFCLSQAENRVSTKAKSHF